MYNENSISNIYILIFDFAPNDTGAFVDLAKIHNRTDNTDNNTVTCRADLPRTGTHDIVVLANLPDALKPDNIADLAETMGTTKAHFIAYFEDQSKGAAWDMSRPIPLWGEITEITTTQAHNHKLELEIDLVRSLARIDVKVNTSVTNFKMQTIRLYNASRNWQVIPNPDNWDAGALKMTTAPNESKSGYNPDTDGYLYTLETPGTTYEAQIYTSEAPAGSAPLSDDWTNNTCLVVGGYFGVDNTDKLTYYRIDFTDANGNYLPLLRNHKYTVTINGVLYHGQGSPEAALAAHPVNSMYSTVEWVSQQSNITVEGRYTLSVNRPVVYLPKTGNENTNSDYELTITTNHSGGWTAEVTSGNEWLSLSAAKGDSDNTTIYLYTDGNDTDADREGTIKFKAGYIELPVKVIQRNFDGVSIEWEGKTNKYLEIKAALGEAPDPVDATVKWSGAGDLAITKNTFKVNTQYNVVQPFEWEPGDTTTAYATHGICEQTYTIAPEALPSWWADVYPVNDGGNAKRETAYYFGDEEINIQLQYE